MKKRFFLALMAAAVTMAWRAEAQAIVVANPSVKASELSKDDLRDLFTGIATTLRDGSHVMPVLLKEGSTHDQFLSAYIGKSDGAFRASWRSLVFSGQGAMPKTVDSEAAMVDYVARTPGAVGYIGRATGHQGLKVLAVR